LLLLTCRSDETTPALNHLLNTLDRERLVTELRLHRFTVREVDEMLRAIFELKRPVRAEFLASHSPIQTVSASPEEFEPYELTGRGL